MPLLFDCHVIYFWITDYIVRVILRSFLRSGRVSIMVHPLIILALHSIMRKHYVRNFSVQKTMLGILMKITIQQGYSILVSLASASEDWCRYYLGQKRSFNKIEIVKCSIMFKILYRGFFMLTATNPWNQQ